MLFALTMEIKDGPDAATRIARALKSAAYTIGAGKIQPGQAGGTPTNSARWVTTDNSLEGTCVNTFQRSGKPSS